MKLKLICNDEHGAALVEATVTIPLFLSLIFGLLQAGLLLWTQAGLQHGVDMASRCASVSVAANNAKAPTSLCFPNWAPASGAVPTATIQAYAAKNSWSLSPPASIFVVNNNATCSAGISGYQVSVSNYSFDLINYIFSLKLSAQSCYPT